MTALTLTAGTAHASTVEQARKEIDRLFGDQARTARCIVQRESNWNPRAINWRDHHRNGVGSFGLFQLGRIWIGYSGGRWQPLLDPVTNVRVAHRIYIRFGWTPWGGAC